MKRSIAVIIFLIGLVSSVFLMYYSLYTYMIVAVTITVLDALYLIKGLFQKQTPESLYNQELGEITKTYEPILVDIKTIPEFDVKNIIIVPSFEKLADVQYELKKPILFNQSEEASSFILMDVETAYVFTLKIREESYSPLEEVIEEIELNARKRKRDKKILEEIEKTTIIKLDNLKEYKVSPIRKIELEKIEEVTTQKDDEEEIELLI